jgi:hypothetical protein
LAEIELILPDPEALVAIYDEDLDEDLEEDGPDETTAAQEDDSTTEELAIYEFFKLNLKSKTPPLKCDLVKYIDNSESNLTWVQVRKIVANRIGQKNKK